MTKIYIKGILAKKYGNFFNLKISNAYSALKAIDANRTGFMKDLLHLSNKNMHYVLICDNEEIKNINELIEKRNINTLYILPAIVGFGSFLAAAMGFVTATGTLTITGMVIATVINTAISMGIQLAMAHVAASINKQGAGPQIAPKSPESARQISVGGSSSAVESGGRSFIFSNKLNSAQQGSSIPIGYGSAKIASKIISISLKNYPVSSTYSSEFENLQNVTFEYLKN